MTERDATPAVPPTDPVHVFLIAAEESGDQLGAALIEALKRATAGKLRISGVGGRAMQAAGLVSLFPIDELSIIGFASIPRRLPSILRRIRQAADAVLAGRPDVLVIIDSPDFTHRVARRVRAAAPSIPIVDYVSPSVWAWRPGRARAMRRYVDHVLALLPFEPAAHRRLGGPTCTYVGHPLIERVQELRPSNEEAVRRNSEPPRLLVLPGSRASEIHHMLGVFGQAIEIIGKTRSIDLVIPTVPHLYDVLQQATAEWKVKPEILVDRPQKYSAFRQARAAIATSGTVTLELAVAGVPTVAAYKASTIEAWVYRRFVRVPSVILANLVLGENIVPEFIQDDCTAASLANALGPLISDTPARKRQIEAFSRLDHIMDIGGAPAGRAADVVLSYARQR
jgi:lipid-A-disaccharide synthase